LHTKVSSQTHFFTVTDKDESKEFYRRSFGGKANKPDTPCQIAQLPTSEQYTIRIALDWFHNRRALDRRYAADNLLTSGTQFNTGLSSAVRRPDRAPHNPRDRRTAAGVSPPRLSSDIGCLDNAAGSTRVRAKPLKSRQVPAFRN